MKLYSRPGNDLTPRFPLIVGALARLRSRSCIIDGEAVACGDDGIACFELIRQWDSDHSVFMWAVDLIELDGVDRSVGKELRLYLQGRGGITFFDHGVLIGIFVVVDGCTRE